MTFTFVHLVLAIGLLAMVLALMCWQGVFRFATLVRASALVVVGVVLARWIA